MAPGFGKLNMGLGHDPVAEVAAQLVRSAQVDLTADHLGELTLHPGQAEVTRSLAGLELDQHVHVGIRPKVAAQHRPEQRQPADVIAAAELRDFLVVQHDLGTHD